MTWVAAVLILTAIGVFLGGRAARRAAELRKSKPANDIVLSNHERRCDASLEALRRIDGLARHVCIMDATVQSYLDLDCGERRVTERLLRFTTEVCDMRVSLATGTILALPETLLKGLRALSGAIPEALDIISSRDRQLWSMRMQAFLDRRAECFDALLKQWFEDGRAAGLAEHSSRRERGGILNRMRHKGMREGITPPPSPPM